MPLNVNDVALRDAIQTLLNAARAYTLEDVQQLINGTISGGKLQFTKGSGTVPVGNLPTLGGDLSGTISAATVIKIQGRGVSSTAPTTGYLLRWDGTNWTPASIVVSPNYVIDGGGSAIATGVKGGIIFDAAYTITGVTLTEMSKNPGSIVVDVWKCTSAQFDDGTTHPVAADSICAAALPTLNGSGAGAYFYQDTTLTGWTKTINAGDIIWFNVNSAVTVQRVNVDLKLVRA